MNQPPSTRSLPWIVATVLFMQQLDSTIVNTAVPSIADSLRVDPLDLKSVVACYTLSMAVCIPASRWMADRFGTRRVFLFAVGVFTLASVLCGAAQTTTALVCARLLQGAGAAFMAPVGRMTIVRTYPKAELLAAMNFVVLPPLLGRLMGPTVGGLIVHWWSWRDIFFVNVPVGVLALGMIYRHLPDYREEGAVGFDLTGMVLYGGAVALLSWLMGVFDTRHLGVATTAWLFVIAGALLVTYGVHASRAAHPLLRLLVFKLRTFRISVLGGFLSHFGTGGLQFLLSLLYQVGFGFTAWKSGLLLIPSAAAAMAMKFLSEPILRRFGYRHVLIVNTVLLGMVVGLFSLVQKETPIAVIVCISLSLGFLNSLQFSSLTTMTYADVEKSDASTASSIASSFQQLSISFGLSTGSLLAAWLLADLPQENGAAVTDALHLALRALAVVTALSAIAFSRLRVDDGATVSRGKP
jgi:EmrB/QacA subfamily drug resistance transporter